MGAYLSTTALSLLLPGYFTGNTTTSDAEGTLIAQHHIERAEAKINAALALRYTVPFGATAVPPIVRAITEDFTAYNLLKATGFRQGQLNEYIDEYYKDSSEILKKLSAGEMPLTATDGSLVAVKSTSRYLSSSENYEMTFNIDKPENWSENTTEQEDVSDTRG